MTTLITAAKETSCLVSLVDIENCKVKPSIRVELFTSPIVNLLSLFKTFVSLK